MRRNTLLIGLGAMLSLCLAQAAQADLLYAIGGSDDNQTLYTVTPSSGVATGAGTSITGLPTVPTGSHYNIQGLAFDPSSGNLFATFGNSSLAYLVEINPQTGAVLADPLITGVSGDGNNFAGLAFYNGKLYVMEPSRGYLEIDNPSSGVATTAYDFHNAFNDPLTSNGSATDPVFYGQANNSLETISTVGTFSPVGTSGVLTSGILSMAYDSTVSSTQIYAIGSSGHAYGTISTAGTSNLQTITGAGTYEALAFSSVTPEPSTLVQAGIGIVGSAFLLIRRRRRV